MAKFEIQATAIAKIVGNAAEANDEKIEAIRNQLVSAYEMGRHDKADEIRSVLSIE